MMTRIVLLLLLPLFILIALQKGGNTMATSKSQATTNTEIPLIDLSVPVKTETATFALG
jgi:hypothetical protein